MISRLRNITCIAQMIADFRHKSLADPPPPEAGSPLANLAEKETDELKNIHDENL